VKFATWLSPTFLSSGSAVSLPNPVKVLYIL
jgi:hypothetical protein